MKTEDLRKLALMEETYANELMKLANSIKHPVLRSLFESIAKDSEKHALMYKAVIEVLESTQPFISEEDLKRVTVSINQHIETEIKMLNIALSIASEAKDPRVKLLISAIADDESRHHKLLLNIKEKIAKPETLTEDILWEMIWKDSPWHGTPGG
ncbi:MAG: ferritin-like domain-containing protein [Desulfurococcaceae archaeon]|jgi:rubrerythrin